jgi:hypothetical protein
MAWVEALLTKSFIEEGAHDVDGFKGLEKSFNKRHGGNSLFSRILLIPPIKQVKHRHALNPILIMKVSKG